MNGRRRIRRKEGYLRRIWGWRLCLLIMLWLFAGTVCAYADELDLAEPFLDTMEQQLDFEEIERFLGRQTEAEILGFRETMELLLDGRFMELCSRVLDSLRQQLFVEIRTGSRMMGQILALGLLGAVFTNFSEIFRGSQISETGFFVTYLLVFTGLTAGLGGSVQVAAETVERTLSFMKVLAPVYFLAVVAAGGSISAAAMYEFTLVMVAAAQWLLGSVMLPGVRMYLLLVMTGNMVKEAFLSRLTELCEQLINWGLKTLLGVVVGFHLIQGMVLPHVDSLKNSSLQKVISMIPGVGQGASVMTQLLLSSGILIKNTIGMAAVVILLIMAAVPVLKLTVMMWLYQCVAAVMEPVCDKRLVACVAAAGNGHKLLLKIVATAVLLLILTIALVCAGTSVR